MNDPQKRKQLNQLVASTMDTLRKECAEDKNPKIFVHFMKHMKHLLLLLHAELTMEWRKRQPLQQLQEPVYYRQIYQFCSTLSNSMEYLFHEHFARKLEYRNGFATFDRCMFSDAIELKIRVTVLANEVLQLC
jgi:hypothetical protein